MNEYAKEIRKLVSLRQFQRITVDYSGRDDDGVVDNARIDGKEVRRVDLRDAILDMAEDILQQEYGGYEIDEGSSGTITFIIDGSKMHYDIDHYYRYGHRETAKGVVE